MKWFSIIGMCIAAAVLYGVVHDQITARICIEYFTIGHVDVGLRTPTAVGLYWGIVATWWVGAGLGAVLATCARFGRSPKLAPRELRRPLLTLVVVTACMAVIAGVIGWQAASANMVWLNEDLAARVPPERHIRFLIDVWIHSGSYAAGGLGGIFLCGWICGIRRERSRTSAAMR